MRGRGLCLDLLQADRWFHYQDGRNPHEANSAVAVLRGKEDLVSMVYAWNRSKLRGLSESAYR